MYVGFENLSRLKILYSLIWIMKVVVEPKKKKKRKREEKKTD